VLNARSQPQRLGEQLVPLGVELNAEKTKVVNMAKPSDSWGLTSDAFKTARISKCERRDGRPPEVAA
jgi:hypothetical protein